MRGVKYGVMSVKTSGKSLAISAGVNVAPGCAALDIPGRARGAGGPGGVARARG